MPDDKTKPDPAVSELAERSREIKQIGAYLGQGATFGIKFHLHDPASTDAYIRDKANENKGLRKALDGIDQKPQIGVGAAAIPAGPLSDKKLSELVDFDHGGGAIKPNHINAFKKEFNGIDPAAPGAATPGNILETTKNTLTQIKTNAAQQVNALIYEKKQVSPADWNKAFQKPLNDYKANITARIDKLKKEKFADVRGALGYNNNAQDEIAYGTAKNAQIASLENLKTEFEKEVVKLQKETLFTAIREAKFNDTRPAPPAGGHARLGRAAAQPLLSNKRPHTLHEHVQFQRRKELDLEGKLGKKVDDRRIIPDKYEVQDEKKPYTPGRYEVKSRFWRDMWYMKDFDFIEDEKDKNKIGGILIKGECSQAAIEEMLKAFDAATGGKEEAVLTVSGDVSFSSLEKLANAVEARRDAGGNPKRVTLSEETKKALIEKNKLTEEQVDKLVKKLEGPPPALRHGIV